MTKLGSNENEAGEEAKPDSDDKAAGDNDAWAAAIRSLSKRDAECLSSVKVAQNGHHTVLCGLLQATNEKKQECMMKQWKVTLKGRKIILRDILEKISVWVSKIIHIGDIAVQYDPVSAALPWAAVRLIMKATVNDVEVFGYVLQSIEAITNVIASSSIFELQYCKPRAISTLKLYSAILHFLASIIHHFANNSIVRFIKNTVFSKSDMEGIYKDVDLAKKEVWDLAQLAEAEKTDLIYADINSLRDYQSSDREAQEANFAQLGSLLHELTRPINRVTNELEAIRDGLEKAERGKILKAISNIPYKLHHKAARKGRLEGSGQWLLQKPEFYEWRERSTSSVIWLHGIPGSGKTKLTSLVVDELEETENLAYFYCMRNPAEPSRGQGEKILSSLVRQLAITRSNSAILSPVADKYEDAVSGLAEFEDQAWTSDESRDILLELMNHYPSVTIVLDALDEVNQEDRQSLMDVLSQLLKDSSNLLKIFISSRDNYDISLHLADSPNVYIEADDNASDIKAFIETELNSARLLSGRLSDELRSESRHSLSEGAHGMFRWVALQIQFLRPLKVAADIRARLGVLPATLEESYWEIYQQIMSSGNHAARLATFTFRWLLYARDTIPLDAFAVIASSHLSDANSPYTFSGPEILDVCANLVVLRTSQGYKKESFELAHLSVREFLEGLPKRKVDTFREDISNASLGSACMHHLTRTYRKSGLLSTQADEESAQKGSAESTMLQIAARILDKPDTRYSTTHWNIHVQDSGNHQSSQMPLIKDFVFDKGDPDGLSQNFKMWTLSIQNSEDALEGLWYAEQLKEDLPDPIWLALELRFSELAELVCENRRQDFEKKKASLSTKDTSFNMMAPFRSALLKRPVEIAECIGRYMIANGVAETAPLAVAAEPPDTELLTRLLSQEHGGLKAETEAVISAARHGNSEALKLLISHNKLAIERAMGSAISRAMEYITTPPETFGGSGMEVLTLLLENMGTSWDKEGMEAAYVLHRAVGKERADLVEIFLNRQIGLNGRSTALVLAVSNGDSNTTKLLLQRGAEKIGIAVVRALTFETPTSAVNLIKAGFEITGRYLWKRRTALHYAAEKGFSEVVKCLLERNVPLDVCDRDGNTPLHLAAARGKKECAGLLLDHGADVLKEDQAGSIPLDIAEERSHEPTAELIRSHMLRLMEVLEENKKLREAAGGELQSNEGCGSNTG